MRDSVFKLEMQIIVNATVILKGDIINSKF